MESRTPRSDSPLCASTPEEASERDSLESAKRSFAELRKAYFEQVRRSAGPLTDPRAGSKPLRYLADQIRILSRLIHSEVLKTSSAGRSLLSHDSIHDLILLKAQWIERLENQLWLLARCEDWSAELSECIDRLVDANPDFTDRTQRLARRILDDSHCVPTGWLLLPEAGMNLADVLAKHHRIAEPIACANGVDVARLVARAVHAADIEAGRRELVVTSALLQDCGHLFLDPGLSADGEHTTGASANHPRIGAALIARATSNVDDLIFLVAAHHERLDGSGYPHGLTGCQISREARLLGIVTRLVELLRRSSLAAIERNVLPGIADIHRQAADTLAAEAGRGLFDAELTRRVLNELGLDAVESDSSDVLERLILPARLRGHDAHTESDDAGRPANQSALRGPKFLRRRKLSRVEPPAVNSRVRPGDDEPG